MTKIGRRHHPYVSIEPGDCVIFSSSSIPGNTGAVSVLQKSLVKQGATVFVNGDEGVKMAKQRNQGIYKKFTHVSGHPHRDELRRLYNALRPATVVTVHGTADHQADHQDVASETGVAHTISPDNGWIVQLTEEGPKHVGRVPCDLMIMEGEHSSARRASWAEVERPDQPVGGAQASVMVLITVVLDAKGEMAYTPTVSVQSLSNKVGQRALQDVAQHIPVLCEKLLADVPKSKRHGYQLSRENVRELMQVGVLESMAAELEVPHDALGIYVHVQSTPGQVVSPPAGEPKKNRNRWERDNSR
jgi:ribonuclease J